MKKLLLTLLLLLSLGFAASAAEASITFSAQGYGNGTEISNVKMNDDITLSLTKGGNTNPPKYYTSGSALRLYGNNTITVSGASGVVITQVVFTTASSNGTFLSNASADKGTFAASSKTWTGSENSFTITNGTATSGHTKITAVTVTYEPGAPVTPACATPKFSMENGAEVFAGQTISVEKGNATACTLLVDNEPVEGLEYTIPETAEVGSTITITANSTLEGGDPATATASITVTVVDVPLVADFVFANYVWSNGTVVTTVKEGIVTLNFDKKGNSNYPKYFTNNNDVRLYGGGALTISVDRAYYITKIESVYKNTDNGLTADCGSFNTGYTEWTNVADGVECKKSAVTFTESGTSGNRSWTSIKVTYAKREIWIETADVNIAHAKAAGVLTVKYSFEVANHNGIDPEVIVTVDGMDLTFEKVEEQAAAPARVAGENTMVSGTLKAKHADLKGATNLNIKVAASLEGDELYSEEHRVTTTTGIEDVTVDGNAAAEYFNLQGVRVAEPRAGQVYIVRRGATVTKELVK